MFALLIDAAIRSSLLAMLAWLGMTTARNRSHEVQLLTWRLVLVAAILIPLLLIALPLLTSPARLPDSIPLQTDLINVVSAVEWPDAVFAIYSAITGGLLLRDLAGLWRGWTVSRRSIAAPLVSFQDPSEARKVRLTAELSAPATFASTVLLPANALAWDAATRRAVVAHERAHAIHGDFYFRLAARLYRAFFWFSPLAWILPSHLVLLEEMRSDEVGARSMQDRAAYAALLIEIARVSSASSGQVAMADSTLSKRIEHLLGKHSTHGTPRLSSRILILLSAFPLITYAAVAGVDSAAYRCRQSQTDQSPIVLAFGNCIAPASTPSWPLALPEYPGTARRSGVEGTVVLHLLVGTDGTVRYARIGKSSGNSQLDEAATATARQWQISPGTVAGRPIEAWGNFAVTFKLSH